MIFLLKWIKKGEKLFESTVFKRNFKNVDALNSGLENIFKLMILLIKCNIELTIFSINKIFNKKFDKIKSIVF